MDKISFQLVTPERTVLQKELTSLSCPTTLGQITILPHHIGLVATLVPGELHAKSDTEDFYISVAGGFVEVKANNQIVVLADAAAHHYEINVEQEQEAVQRAKAAMQEKHLSEEEYAKVAAALEKSLSRINVARKHAHRKGPLTGSGLLNE